MGDPRQRNWTEEFKREAVRLLKTSGRTVGEVAADLGALAFTPWGVEVLQQILADERR